MKMIIMKMNLSARVRGTKHYKLISSLIANATFVSPLAFARTSFFSLFLHAVLGRKRFASFTHSFCSLVRLVCGSNANYLISYWIFSRRSFVDTKIVHFVRECVASSLDLVTVKRKCDGTQRSFLGRGERLSSRTNKIIVKNLFEFVIYSLFSFSSLDENRFKFKLTWTSNWLDWLICT